MLANLGSRRAVVLRVYQTEHGISRKVCQAFAEGSGGQLASPTRLLDGPAATYGILRGTSEVLLECERLGREFYYVDHGYFRPSDHARGDFSGYYRVTCRGYQVDGSGDHSSARWSKLGIRMRPWRTDGRHVLVFPMSYNVAVHRGLDPKAWLRETVAEVARYTDREVVVKPKSSDLTLAEALRDAWCVVGHETTALIGAVVAGVPAFVLGDSAARAVGCGDLSRIEDPVRLPRRQWACNLAANQWTLDEFRDGTAWRELQETKE